MEKQVRGNDHWNSRGTSRSDAGPPPQEVREVEGRAYDIQ